MYAWTMGTVAVVLAARNLPPWKSNSTTGLARTMSPTALGRASSHTPRAPSATRSCRASRSPRAASCEARAVVTVARATPNNPTGRENKRKAFCK